MLAHLKPLVITGVFSIISIVAPATTAAGESGTEREPRRYSTRPIAPEEIKRWEADLDLMIAHLETEHPDPYWRTSPELLAAEAAKLRAGIPGMAAHEILTAFASLLALVGDGHTSLPLYSAEGVDFHIVPFRVGIYEDGVWIEGADRAYEQIVGGKLIAIGGVDSEEALDRVSSLISRDNDNWISAVAPHLFNRIEVLHALGLASGLETVDLTVRIDEGEVTRTLRALEEPQKGAHGLPFLPEYTSHWVDARRTADREIPWYQRDFEEVYGWRYDEARDLLYIKWDQVQNRPHGPSALEVFRQAMTLGREKKPARTVIDIRNNTGGEGGLLPPVVREIVRTREIDRPGHLFLVIGRRTFSAAQMLTSMLEQFSEAILVGEPSSAFYNGYAGHVMKTLPHSGVTFAISPDYYQMGHYPGDPRTQATPRIAAVPTFQDYVANRDPALEAIEGYNPDATERLRRAVSEAIASGDRSEAESLARRFDAEPENRYFDSTRVLNRLGYDLIRAGDQMEAIDVFRLNVTIHPLYANGWDSLGEAYARTERLEEARRAFERALELDPDLESSRRWLERLK